MKLLSALLIAAAATGAVAQDLPQTAAEATKPIRIRIRHADPWAVKTLLEGGELRFPELSTILNLGGAPGGGMQGGGAGGGQRPGGQGGTGNAWFVGGKLIVNPTDNSIWFIPDRK
jgi:hypothetical protein